MAIHWAYNCVQHCNVIKPSCYAVFQTAKVTLFKTGREKNKRISVKPSLRMLPSSSGALTVSKKSFWNIASCEGDLVHARLCAETVKSQCSFSSFSQIWAIVLYMVMLQSPHLK